MASRSGLGSNTLWGLTPAVNLLTFLDDKTLIEADSDEKGINILLLGQSDCRHVFKTLEEHLNFRTNKIKINVYIAESNIELYARQLLFLTLANLPLEKLGLYEKTRQFLELYGNTSLRPKTQQSLRKVARRMIKLITDDDYAAKKMPFLKLTDLKFVERDSLVEICKYWTEFCHELKENLNDKWDRRLRYHLGSRYDSRQGAFDWDYHMRLRELVEIVSAAEYKKWRNTGMAFTDYDSEYSQPNVTLTSGASLTSNWKSVCFLGEIITGPFIAYGVECEDKTLFEKANDRHKFSSGDVTVHNVERIFEVIHRKNTESNKAEGGTGDAASAGGGGGDQGGLTDCFSITFLPMDSAKHIHLKSQFARKFHLVYFSSTMAQNLTPALTTVLRKEAVVIVEGVRYFLELREGHVQAYNEKVAELAATANLQKLSEDEAFHVDYHCFTNSPLLTPNLTQVEGEEQESSADEGKNRE